MCGQTKNLGLARTVVYKRHGFSLVEIIIVVGMVSVLATITMINFKGNTIQDRVQSSANVLQSTMTLARTYARTGKVCCGDQSAHGYGVVLSLSGQTLKLYGDRDDNLQYTDGTDDIIATSTIDEKVEFDSPITDFLFTAGANSTVHMDGEDWTINGTITMTVQEIKLPHTEKKTVTLYYPSGLIDQP